jgi:2-(1,2-epoxy-1,2-dihydrophenyl)acetyl-CoA isomerase
MVSREVDVQVNAAIATITLNRPSALNSLTARMLDDLHTALDEQAGSSAVRCVVLTGAGRAFCAGQDLQDPTVSATGSEPPALGALLDDHYSPLVRRIRDMPVPTVAAVNGVAAGGGANLALACDIVIASESAVFIQAFSKIGLIPDVAGPWTLPRLVGRARALGLAMLGDSLAATDAARIGLIWKCAPDGDFDAAVTATAQALSELPTRALVETRQVIDAAMNLDLDAALLLEARHQDRLGRANDFAEGVAAFLDKRPPNFTDR